MSRTAGPSRPGRTVRRHRAGRVIFTSEPSAWNVPSVTIADRAGGGLTSANAGIGCEQLLALRSARLRRARATEIRFCGTHCSLQTCMWTVPRISSVAGSTPAVSSIGAYQVTSPSCSWSSRPTQASLSMCDCRLRAGAERRRAVDTWVMA